MRIFLSPILCLSLVVPAVAGFEGPGTPAKISTVANALQAHDDMPCVLEGYIIQRVTGEDDEYVFQDPSGKIIVEIDNKVFNNQKVTPKDKVRLSGKVEDKKMRKNKVEVSLLEIL